MKNKIQKIIAGIALGLLLYIPQTQAATLSLVPSSGELRMGCTNTVSIYIDTQGRDSNAVDAFMSYNPNEIEIIDQLGSFPGTQLGIGKVYKSYPGNIVGNGSIKLTAFNDSGFFNGRGQLATIKFKSKPGVTQTTISFRYSPGSSTDSNIADPSAQDILSGVSNATFRFVEGACYEEKKPVLKPSAPQEPAPVVQEAEPTEEPMCVCPTEELKPAAPETRLGDYAISFFLLFMISLFLNFYLIMKDHMMVRIHFEKHKIQKARKK